MLITKLLLYVWLRLSTSNKRIFHDDDDDVVVIRPTFKLEDELACTVRIVLILKP